MDRIQHILTQPALGRVLVVGLARSGRSAARLLAARGAEVIGTDRQAAIADAADLRRDGVQLALGGDRVELVERAQLLVLSPGVWLHSPLVREANSRDVPCIGELELAFRLQRTPTLAITGTNGKSTTTALCAHLLRSEGLSVFLGGNIGRPLCDLLLAEQEVDWAVVEVSSFQLEHLSDPRAFVPQVGVWLNLTPDHLDRHGSMTAYADIKRRMFGGQTDDHLGVFFFDDERVRHSATGLRCSQRFFGRQADRLRPEDACIEGGCFALGADVFRLTNPRLFGDHNAENAAAATLAAIAAGVRPASVQRALDDFSGLPHRLEPVREVDGVRWIDDSKGTNPDAAAKSLTGFDAKVVLIAGGRGKGTDYRELRKPVAERVAHLVLLGEDADRLAADLSGCAPIHRVDGMDQAVALARRLAAPGDVVLLSPACASFDMFDDYAHRGRVFAEQVRALEEHR